MRIASLIFVAIAAAPLSVSAFSGELQPLPQEIGCLSQNGVGECRQAGAGGVALWNPFGLAVTPNGKTLYGVSSYAVVRYDRDKGTGAVSEPGEQWCISRPDDPAEPLTPECEHMRMGDPADSPIVSPDGKFLYVLTNNGGRGFGVGAPSIAAFAIDKRKGTLTQLEGDDGCIGSTSGAAAMGCRSARQMDHLVRMAMSPDGETAYAYGTSSSSGLVIFARDKKTGGLTQLDGELGCWNTTGANGCTAHPLLDGNSISEMAVSRDGRSLYMAKKELLIFSRNKRKKDGPVGAVTYERCIAATSSNGCDVSPYISIANGVAISRNGKFVYVTSHSHQNVVGFERNKSARHGVVGDLGDVVSCVANYSATSAPEDCERVQSLGKPRIPTFSTNGRQLYVTSSLTGPSTLQVDKRSGELSFAGCLNQGPGCGPNLNYHPTFSRMGPRDFVVAKDGKHAYITGNVLNGNQVPADGFLMGLSRAR